MNFMADNINDVRSRTTDVLKVSDMTLDEYLDCIEMDQVRPDEIALFYLAMQHSVHVKVILKRGYWSTGEECSEDDYALVLVYVGQNVWRDTVPGAAKHDDSRPVRSPRAYVRKDTELSTLLGSKYKRQSRQEEDRERKSVTLQENTKGKLLSLSYSIPKTRPVAVVQRWCHLCRDRFVSLRLLNWHMIEVHEQMYQCDICGDTLASRETLRRHKSVQHSDADKPFKCSQCTKSFLFRSHLASHVRTHSTEHRHVCPAGKCGRKFKHKGDLKHHFIAKHESPDQKLKCAKCPLTFQTNKLLKLHAVIHEPPARRCQYCEEVFHWHSQLRNHVTRTHLDKSSLKF